MTKAKAAKRKGMRRVTGSLAEIKRKAIYMKIFSRKGAGLLKTESVSHALRIIRALDRRPSAVQLNCAQLLRMAK